MKRRTWIMSGGVLLALVLAAGWYRYATRPQNVTVTFEGFAQSDRGWTAVFRLTNGTPNTVFCSPSLRSNAGRLLRENRSLYSTKILAPHTGLTWLHPVPETNSVFRLQVACSEAASRLANLENDLIRWFHGKFPSSQVALRHRREYLLTCPTEADQGARKLERP